MSDQEFIIAIVGISVGSAFLIYTVKKITGLIQSWMNHHHEQKIGSQPSAEFQEFKNITERRLQNLEAIIADQETTALKEPTEDLTQEIEFPDQEEVPSQSKPSSGDSRLSNMLD
jgi:hypothetical protein